MPADRNGFSVPVVLTTDVSNVPASVRANLAFFWIDPATNDWVLIENSTVDPNTGRLSASLDHFSNYAVGNRNLSRAGW